MRPSKLLGPIALVLWLPFLAINLASLPALIRSASRADERALPTATVENGQTIYCRMRLCDFRFPIPSDTRVDHFDHVKGGMDTIDGEVLVTSNQNSSIDMQRYAAQLKQQGFNVSICEECPSLSAGSTAPLGGSISVDDFGETITIRFGYFGDY